MTPELAKGVVLLIGGLLFIWVFVTVASIVATDSNEDDETN